MYLHDDLPATDEPTTSAGRAIGMVLISLVLAALLCADALVQIAERQPFGTTRDIALSVTRTIRSASEATRLDRPREWLVELTGGELPSSVAGEELDVPTATAPTTPELKPPTGPKPNPHLGTTTTVPPTTTTTLPPHRTPTPESPLVVVMFGDSMMGNVAIGFQRMATSEPRMNVYAEYHVSTGLARPDVLDWPAYLNQVLPTFGSEVVMLAFGANDDQDMQSPEGVRLAYGTPEWEAEYTRRVALTMDVAAQDGRSVVWLGLPAVNRERLEGARRIINRIGQEQAELRPAVTFVDLGETISPNGVFELNVPGPGGAPVRARAEDGVHISIAGGELVAPELLAAFAVERRLAAPPPPPPTTTAPPTTAPPASPTTTAPP
jgi:hypothetical protein